MVEHDPLSYMREISREWTEQRTCLLGRKLTFGDEEQIAELKRLYALEDFVAATQTYILELDKYLLRCKDLSDLKNVIKEGFVKPFYDKASPSLLSHIIEEIWKEDAEEMGIKDDEEQ